MAKQIRTLIPAPNNTCYNSLLLFGNFVEKIAWRVLKMAFQSIFKYENFLVRAGASPTPPHTSPMVHHFRGMIGLDN